MQDGLIPQVMEDKWFIYYEEPCLFFHRSWTGEPVFRVTLKPGSEGAEAGEVLWSKHLATLPGADPAYQAQLLDVLVSNLLLDQSKPFPVPANLKESMRGVYQHAVAGPGYKEVRVPVQAAPAAKSRKPWWRFW